MGLVRGWDVTEENTRGRSIAMDFVVRNPFVLAVIREQLQTWLASR